MNNTGFLQSAAMQDIAFSPLEDEVLRAEPLLQLPMSYHWLAHSASCMKPLEENIKKKRNMWRCFFVCFFLQRPTSFPYRRKELSLLAKGS